MSYPYFRCSACDLPVQKAICYDAGRLPYLLLTHRSIPVSDVFDTDQAFAYCRGQGLRYGEVEHPKTMPYVHGYHYNFSAAFKGYCCFCALHAGFGEGLFWDTGCYGCKRRQLVIAEFIALTKTKEGESVSWRNSGWAALPSAIIDRIVCHVFGDRLVVEDGVPRPPVPDAQFE